MVNFRTSCHSSKPLAVIMWNKRKFPIEMIGNDASSISSIPLEAATKEFNV